MATRKPQRARLRRTLGHLRPDVSHRSQVAAAQLSSRTGEKDRQNFDEDLRNTPRMHDSKDDASPGPQLTAEDIAYFKVCLSACVSNSSFGGLVS